MMGYQGLTLALELMLTLIYNGRLEAFRFSLPDGALAGVKILDISSSPVLYRHDGDSVQELLDICPEKVKNPGDGGCTAECPLVSPEITASGPVCSKEDKKILKRLKAAQEIVAAFKNKVEFSSTETSINFMILLVTVSMGIFLFYRKHFLYKTMCDSRLADPTSGMPLWQFRRMKFTPTTVPDTRPHEERVRERWEKMSKTQIEKEALAKLELHQKKSSMIPPSPNFYLPSDDDDGSIPVPGPRAQAAQGQAQGQGQGQGQSQGFELNPIDIDYAQAEAEAMAANEKKPKKTKGKIRRFFSKIFNKGKKEDSSGLADDEAEDEEDDEEDEADGGHRRHHFRHRDPRHLHPIYETGRKTAPVKLSSSRRHSSTGSSARAPPSPPPPTTTTAPTAKKEHGRDKKVTIVVPEPEHPV